MSSERFDDTLTESLAPSIEGLREALFELLENYPNLRPFQSSVAGAKGTRLKRYVSLSGCPVGHEHTLTTHQNLWVRRDDVRRNRLSNIEATLKSASELKNSSGANSNLFAVPEFEGCDLLRFKVVNLAQGALIINEVLS